MNLSKSTRNNFDPLYVIKVLGNETVEHTELVRVLAEACHKIVADKQRMEIILHWYHGFPGLSAEDK